ncbi:TPA: peptide-methionine (S)-S-oxide reductase [Candidatus Berkelbacteria bacterium]|uniref:Peptide methionine sulfoxide reductase MsrA n=1 Tax=Berkelbacteria bacterium GW2011_GWE1_39_12 TaxID=1618337 RepID=A0A0G4B583_9BACT|nr:MAG: methionine sulfoxide reductase A, peptide-methionine (S)-S-oxide reductase [Berkelbacteria bacterium GW2011_GWE1_39_12]HBO60333.1 peptide-methionine (S)-S-oxide reductase [Candidatus Berkelbacteria bacterium]
MTTEKYEKVFFAAGCFWGVEEAFYKISGVLKTEVGFMGGKTENPTYEQVCSNMTGHAETVEVVYDPKKVSFNDLLSTFWQIHDPTTINRQGPDVGSQYRSAIFYTTEHQKNMAEKSRRKMEETGLLQSKIVTEIESAGPFFKAEDYHQKYFLKHPGQGCHI